MNDSELSSAGTSVLELQWRGLVVILKNVCVVFHLIDRRQFHAMAFKLHGLAHLSARIPTAYVRSASFDSPRRLGRPNAINEESNRPRDPQLFVPGREFLAPQHGGFMSSLVATDAVDSRQPTSKVPFPFSPWRSLRAGSRQLLLLERSHVAHSSFVNQLLQLATVLDGGADVRDEFLWNVNRESTPLVSTVEGVTAVTFTRLANLAVLTDARAFTERQGARGYRPELCDGFEKPAAEIFALIAHRMCELIHI